MCRLVMIRGVCLNQEGVWVIDLVYGNNEVTQEDNRVENEAIVENVMSDIYSYRSSAPALQKRRFAKCVEFDIRLDHFHGDLIFICN